MEDGLMQNDFIAVVPLSGEVRTVRVNYGFGIADKNNLTLIYIFKFTVCEIWSMAVYTTKYD